jgi:hypothetical protein
MKNNKFIILMSLVIIITVVIIINLFARLGEVLAFEPTTIELYQYRRDALFLNISQLVFFIFILYATYEVLHNELYKHKNKKRFKENIENVFKRFLNEEDKPKTKDESVEGHGFKYRGDEDKFVTNWDNMKERMRDI